MIAWGNITGGVIGVSFTFSLWEIFSVVVLGLALGVIYNHWIVKSHEAGKYTTTWALVVGGVVLGLGLLYIIHWSVAVIAMLVFAGLGIPLAWGDASRDREGARDYARHLRKKNKLLKQAGEVHIE